MDWRACRVSVDLVENVAERQIKFVPGHVTDPGPPIAAMVAPLFGGDIRLATLEDRCAATLCFPLSGDPVST